MESLIAKLALPLPSACCWPRARVARARRAGWTRTAGIRTYAITGLLGGLFATLARSLEAPSVLIAGLIAFTAVFAW